ncbi:MAG: ABC transporter permease [Gammaproteobacteria bacterium]|jgi:putative spermidine/putrescine transport system permease protein|nr:ABC transporter permease [Gammaproteobacteria bacterium]
MAFPSYTTTKQKIWHYFYMFFCGFVLFFLVAPLVVVIPLSFTNSPYLQFLPEMKIFSFETWSFNFDGYGTRWYKDLFGICETNTTTVCTDRWMIGFKNSALIAVFATLFATVLGTLAALGLSNRHMPFNRAIMALMISPMIVPLIITATGMFFFFAKANLLATITGLVIAHTILGIPFVVITVTASLSGFDNNLMRAAATLGGSPFRNFFKIQAPLIAPGVISGALFAFITSFDEVVIVLFVGGPDQYTLPRQMWSGIRNEISPTILAAATLLVIFSILLLSTLEMLRRRSERIRGVRPS